MFFLNCFLLLQCVFRMLNCRIRMQNACLKGSSYTQSMATNSLLHTQNALTRHQWVFSDLAFGHLATIDCYCTRNDDECSAPTVGAQIELIGERTGTNYLQYYRNTTIDVKGWEIRADRMIFYLDFLHRL
jgi:hypothetical protein